MAKYRLCPDPRVPAFDQLRGWRWFLNKIFRIPFTRARVVIQSADGIFVCHPDTVSVLTTFWRAHGHDVEIDRSVVVRPAPAGGGA